MTSLYYRPLLLIFKFFCTAGVSCQKGAIHIVTRPDRRQAVIVGIFLVNFFAYCLESKEPKYLVALEAFRPHENVLF